MIVKSRGRSDHLAALERFFERIRQFRLRLNPKKCTFGVTSGKLLGYMVSERGIEVDPDKIRAILTCCCTEDRERKSQPTVWDDQCQRAFERIREYLLSPPVLAPPTPGRPLLYTCPYQTPALVGRLMRWLVLLTEFDIHYVTQKSIRGSIVADHLASLPVSDARAIDDDFPDEDVAAVTSLSGWRISVRLAFSDRHPATNNIVEYEACILGLETASSLGLDRWRAQNQFADALATLASMIDIPIAASLFRGVPSVRYTEISFTCRPRVHALTSPWPFSVWGIDIIGKISPKSSSGHEFILVAIDYFTKWVEAASYARLTSSGVASFIRSHIICRYGVPHELISDRGVHFRAEVDTLVQRYASGIIDRLRTGRRRMGQ
ncbi:hypothetical protein CK203_026179 [Vitis vinifera]|uniref:Integrase catalytic domain-containing protein n=1 Tax=Vitis vinifera TaxID=29760 RepID=A0A438IJ72_VITVI|nr:hypothetical protein CK203_026179 [Vitis vinifera]